MTLEAWLGALGLPCEAPVERLHGGDVAEVWRAGSLVVKRGPRADQHEAEARGVRVVASTACGALEVLPRARSFPPGDVDALARSLLEALDAPRPVASTPRTWDAPALELLGVYRELVA